MKEPCAGKFKPGKMEKLHRKIPGRLAVLKPGQTG